MIERVCFHENARYSGTDLKGSIVRRIKARNASVCQEACQKNEDCKFFLYFSEDHKMWFKRGECRLLRFKGELQDNKLGHISGPKFCGEEETSTVAPTTKFVIELDINKPFGYLANAIQSGSDMEAIQNRQTSLL